MQRLRHDIRYGLRLLLKGRILTLVAVITLALGIGANTAIFSVLDATVLRPLPYQHPDRLVMVWDTFDSSQSVISSADFLDYREQNQLFEGQAAAFEPFDYDLIGNGDPERITGYRVSANLFDVLGAKAHIGRTFLPQEDQPGAPPVIVISYRLWQRRFNSDPNILSRTLTLNEQSYSVVGVMPPGFKFPPPLPFGSQTFFVEADMWSPLVSKELKPQDHRLFALARLRPGVSTQLASAQLSSIAARPEQNHPKNTRAAVVPLEQQAVEHVRLILFVLLGVGGVVMLICCANIANLLLARAISREREIAIQIAIGANRGHIIRQLLTESMLLSLVSGMLGLLLAVWGVDLLWTMTPQDVRYFDHAHLDMKILGFTIGISMLTAFAFGLIPALQSSRSPLTEILKEGRAAGTSISRRRWRGFLIVTEVGLALVLLTGAGLLIRSLTRLLHTDLGFNPNNVLTMNISLPATRYPEGTQQTAFFDKLLSNLERLPGVQYAGTIEQLPIAGGRLRTRVLLEGYPEPASPSEAAQVEWYTVTPNYFRAMNVPLMRGRFFDSRDTKDAPQVVVISEAMASKYWPGEDPIGKRIRLQRSTKGGNMEWGPSVSIVGVVGNVRRRVEVDPAPTIYLTQPQNPSPEMAVAIRTVSDPESIATAARKEVWALDGNLVVTQVRPMTQTVSEAEAQPHFRTLILAILAAIALLLAAIGVYGVISYSVTQRSHEIGVRIALGAQPRNIFKLIIGEALILALIGVAVGLLSAYALTRILSSFLYGISATDPVTFIGVSILLIGVVLIASYIPARRATRVNPMAVLLHE
ncbi:MAG: hypothetical protein AUG51_22055 [Acidobacteria bacterium 13_1_20CM_3_53_8]|nr:MAG: hypothetical protein AUG51_22055 [Acidobacteria bacterium 13_1_20CM_3_53_8]